MELILIETILLSGGTTLNLLHYLEKMEKLNLQLMMIILVQTSTTGLVIRMMMTEIVE